MATGAAIQAVVSSADRAAGQSHNVMQLVKDQWQRFSRTAGPRLGTGSAKTHIVPVDDVVDQRKFLLASILGGCGP